MNKDTQRGQYFIKSRHRNSKLKLEVQNAYGFDNKFNILGQISEVTPLISFFNKKEVTFHRTYFFGELGK